MMLFISVIFVTSKMGIFALVVERLIVTDVRGRLACLLPAPSPDGLLTAS